MSDGPEDTPEEEDGGIYGDLDACPSTDDREADEEDRASHWSASGYDRSVVDGVWQFAEIVPGNDPALWRKDEFGAWINRLDYGRRHSEFGWEICDIAGARAATGLSALRPMQWQNYLDQVAAMTQSRITADGKRNVRRLL